MARHALRVGRPIGPPAHPKINTDPTRHRRARYSLPSTKSTTQHARACGPAPWSAAAQQLIQLGPTFTRQYDEYTTNQSPAIRSPTGSVKLRPEYGGNAW
jgi:hypothetical protein